jgi:hypothetical protein
MLFYCLAAGKSCRFRLPIEEINLSVENVLSFSAGAAQQGFCLSVTSQTRLRADNLFLLCMLMRIISRKHQKHFQCKRQLIALESAINLMDLFNKNATIYCVRSQEIQSICGKLPHTFIV